MFWHVLKESPQFVTAVQQHKTRRVDRAEVMALLNLDSPEGDHFAATVTEGGDTDYVTTGMMTAQRWAAEQTGKAKQQTGVCKSPASIQASASVPQM
ncbi:hypothetical protein SKAU_G00107130 [Synaphobranchus kaupii]|uniref:Uncharacterized protein n=1 Tax=Synaphobranchus kaupii TaxID=118154 RepID=A0A9Q1FZQ1_SYNKA|nr:hypothetical protein SKAU_G00107130 [Synaphobranchus kaupii]